MSDTGSTPTDSQDPGSLWKLTNLDPMLLNLMVTAITAVCALFGIEIGDDKAKLIAVIVFLLVVVGMQVWARARTLSKKKVLAFVPDPVEAPHIVRPGDATTTATDARVLHAVRATPGA